MAQNPHDRSQPSAILTYAHGALERGRGRLSRSRLGTDGAEPPAGAVPLRPSVTGTPKPLTASTSGSAAASSSP